MMKNWLQVITTGYNWKGKNFPCTHTGEIKDKVDLHSTEELSACTNLPLHPDSTPKTRSV